MDPRGRMLLLTMKSSKSSTMVPSPRGAKLDQMLKPKTQGRERMKRAKKLTRRDFFGADGGSFLNAS
jgi:hypothetical protein